MTSTPIRLLLLEDDAADASLALNKLTAAGLIVDGDVTRTAQEFMERLRTTVYNLILCDFRLPGWNGLQALRWVRQSGYSTPFIYVSGTLGEDVAVECIKEGATDYVLKGNLDRLPHVVRRALSEDRLRADRDRALRALNESEERLATAFRSSPEGITISSLNDGRYIEANDAFLRMIEYERAELIGETTGNLGIWVNPEQRESLLPELLGTEPIRGRAAQFRTRSGRVREVEFSAERVQLQGEPCLLAVTRDVTELRQLEQQFREAQKMEAIGRLAGGVAHDFNNMLMVIASSAQMLEDALNDRARFDRHVSLIRGATDRAALLTRQLLAFSRRQVLQPTILDLNKVVGDFWKMLSRLLREDIEVVTAADPRLGYVSADRGQLEQVIVNLVVNARDAMPDGGKLTIETANVDLDAAAAKQHGAAVLPGSYVMLAVSDTGSGMTPDVQARLFEPFFTTKAVGQGTGLGLATVYGIVKQSGGFIGVASEVGKGSAFRIYLPQTEGQGVAAQAPAADEPAPGGSETVLLVEDEDALRQVAAEYLRLQGYAVLEAPGGVEALRLCETHPSPIHVLIADVVMPGMGGPELARAARHIRPNLREIYVSGYTDQRMDANLLGPDALFLQKPFNLNALGRSIRLLLDADSGRGASA